MFDLDATAAPSKGADRGGDTASVTGDRSGGGDRVYAAGDGTERAAWALRCYVRAARGGEAAPLRRPA